MEEETKEQNISSGQPSQSTTLTLQKAIDLGEYKPEFLAHFPNGIHTAGIFSLNLSEKRSKTATDNSLHNGQKLRILLIFA